MDFILEQFSFYFAIVAVLFLPGWFLLQAIFKKNKSLFNPIEKFVISFGLSIVSVDFLIILMGRISVPLTRWSILLMIILFLIACYLIVNISKKSHLSSRKSKILDELANPRISIIRDLGRIKAILFGIPDKLFFYRSQTHDEKYVFRNDSASKNKIKNFNKQTLLIILILFLTIFIKTIYLQNTIFPTSTDLGHHMYWSQQISQTGKLPTYEKIKLKEVDGKYQLTKPQPISDFIIGEHLIFSAISLISGISLISYLPTLILFLINIMGLLAMFILSLRIFNDNFKFSKLHNNQIAILTLLLLGPLWAISSPQTKFVSGGVIGNLLGNFFIPLCLYFYFRAFTEKNSKMLTVALFLTMGLFYTHHLSGFIFLFIATFTTIVFITISTINKKFIIKDYLKIIFSPSIFAFLLAAFCFLFFIYTPAYLSNHATGTAVGAPSKATRAGLTFTQFKYAIGEPRLALGMIGLILITIFSFRKISKHQLIGNSILIGWTLAISLMTIKPQWLHINLPSGRIANYANFPFVILGSFVFVWIINYTKTNSNKLFLPTKIFVLGLFILLISIFSSGSYDNSQSLVKKPNNQKALQTFQASRYLKNYLQDNISNSNIVLKDHNYLKADSWIKLFFIQDYSLPLSRSYFKRYNDSTKPREMCTLWMISEPASERAQKCYNETGVSFIMINPKFDNVQFESNQEFWKVYVGEDIAIYYKP